MGFNSASKGQGGLEPSWAATTNKTTVLTFPNISTTVNNNKKCDPGGFTTTTMREEYRLQDSKAPQFYVIRRLNSYIF